MAVIYDLVSVQVIALLGSDIKLLTTSPDPSFIGQIDGDTDKRTQTTVRKE